MHSKLVSLTLASAAALVAVAPAWAGRQTLTGTVGPEDTIGLSSGGHKVTSIKPGSYTFLVHDLASDHDFHLTGPGIDKTTSIGSTGQSVWHLTLKKGTYRYVCDPHSSYMKGSFTVA